MTACVLLVVEPQGGTSAIRFANDEAARRWEDAHPEVESVGVARLVSSRTHLQEVAS